MITGHQVHQCTLDETQHNLILGQCHVLLMNFKWVFKRNGRTEYIFSDQEFKYRIWASTRRFHFSADYIYTVKYIPLMIFSVMHRFIALMKLTRLLESIDMTKPITLMKFLQHGEIQPLIYSSSWLFDYICLFDKEKDLLN